MAIIQQRQYEVLPPGEYIAVVENVELVEGRFGPQCEFTFLVEGGEDDTHVKGWTSDKFSPKSNLFKWARAIFGGREIPPDYNLNTDDLIGRRVNLLITIKVKEDGSEFSKVDGLRPVRVPANGQQRPQQQQPQRPPAPAAVPPDNWPEEDDPDIPF